MCKHEKTYAHRHFSSIVPPVITGVALLVAIAVCLVPTTKLIAGEDSEDIEILKAMDEAMSLQWLQQDQWLQQELREAPATSNPRPSIHLPLFMRDTLHDPDNRHRHRGQQRE